MSVGRTGSRSSVYIYPQIRFSLYKNSTLWPEHPREESPLCLALGRKFDSKAPRLYRLAPFEGKPARAVGGEGDGRGGSTRERSDLARYPITVTHRWSTEGEWRRRI